MRRSIALAGALALLIAASVGNVGTQATYNAATTATGNNIVP
jgi:hypothetical protein